ncbi:MAG: hypothetical protein TYPL_3410 [Candidatus Tyloplasma litorale]|nr:MAG: hypothetical protein TYPL_3410 [Mycoplasmatales bacterium]
MYLSIKSYSKEKFLEFYQAIGGRKTKSNDDIVFDNKIYDNVKITFYTNLNILFNGKINKKLEKLIDIIIDKELYVGSDEVGIGESIGPIVVVALKFKNYDSKKKVILNGIKDSKKLSAKEIDQKSKFIKKYSDFKIMIMPPNKFNNIYKKLNNIKAINALMQNELHKKFENENNIHITDQFVNENKYNEYILNSNNEPFKGKLILLTKAEEKYLEVAAAAIIAKSIFNNWLINKFKEDGIKINIENNKRLNSWKLFQELNNGTIKVDNKNEYIKKWKK